MLFNAFRSVENKVHNGFDIYDYADAATQTTPLAISANTPTYIPTDAAGFSIAQDKFTDIEDIYDGATGSFDFSKLPLASKMEIRIDLEITTGNADTNVNLSMELASGTGSEVIVPIGDTSFFSTVGSKRIVKYQLLLVGSDLVRNNPAKLLIEADKAITLKVNGYLCDVRKKLRP